MRNRNPFSALRWFSLAFILIGVILFTLQLVRFSRIWAYFPPGLTIGGIPVGQLDRQQAAQRLLEVYSMPIELHYNDAVIQMSPSVVGFELDMESMLAAADLERVQKPFWSAFWEFLWSQSGDKTDIPLKVSYSNERLTNFLETEIASRYDHPPVPALPIVGTINFRPGAPGTSLDIPASTQLIDAALQSSANRVVTLPLKTSSPGRPAFQNLEVLLKQTLDLAHFDGLAGIYLVDLQTAQEIHFLSWQGKPVPSTPDMAFTASSTIKIPIMVSVMRRAGDPVSADVTQHLNEMIGKSGNPPADWLMENVLDKIQGPLKVSEDMQALGLQNTFMAGYFALGSPILKVYKTPANERQDLITDPDPYSQTTPSDIGMLLEDIYQCATDGGGALIAVFPGQINQAKCQQMIDTLVLDHNAVLIQAGVPDGTRLAHKHGWVTDAYGVIHDMSDAGIVYTPAGNYILAIYLYHPTQLVWDSASRLVADLSRAVYNFYNIPSQ
ncbi:MAG: serine hydrolase [Omnitrophica WOR_2 bacterium]